LLKSPSALDEVISVSARNDRELPVPNGVVTEVAMVSALAPGRWGYHLYRRENRPVAAAPTGRRKKRRAFQSSITPSARREVPTPAADKYLLKGSMAWLDLPIASLDARLHLKTLAPGESRACPSSTTVFCRCRGQRGSRRIPSNRGGPTFTGRGSALCHPASAHRGRFPLVPVITAWAGTTTAFTLGTQQ